MTRVDVKTTTWHNGDDDDEESGPWRYRGTTSGRVDGVYVVRDDYNFSYRGFETDLDPPFYVVYAEYTTGDTFGHDFEACVVGVEKTFEGAKALAKEANKEEGYGELSNGFYVPWNGYFEQLHGIYIQQCLGDETRYEFKE